MKYLLIGGQKGGQVYEANMGDRDSYRIARTDESCLYADLQELPVNDTLSFDEYRVQEIRNRFDGYTRKIRALVLVGIGEEKTNTLMNIYRISFKGVMGWTGPKGLGECFEMDFDATK